MSISKARLNTIEASPSALHSFGAILDALVDDQTITAATANIIKHAMDANRAALESSARANLKDAGDKEVLSKPLATPALAPSANRRGVVYDPAGVAHDPAGVTPNEGGVTYDAAGVARDAAGVTYRDVVRHENPAIVKTPGVNPGTGVGAPVPTYPTPTVPGPHGPVPTVTP